MRLFCCLLRKKKKKQTTKGSRGFEGGKGNSLLSWQPFLGQKQQFVKKRKSEHMRNGTAKSRAPDAASCRRYLKDGHRRERSRCNRTFLGWGKGNKRILLAEELTQVWGAGSRQVKLHSLETPWPERLPARHVGVTGSGSSAMAMLWLSQGTFSFPQTISRKSRDNGTESSGNTIAVSSGIYILRLIVDLAWLNDTEWSICVFWLQEPYIIIRAA